MNTSLISIVERILQFTKNNFLQKCLQTRMPAVTLTVKKSGGRLGAPAGCSSRAHPRESRVRARFARLSIYGR